MAVMKLRWSVIPAALAAVLLVGACGSGSTSSTSSSSSPPAAATLRDKIVSAIKNANSVRVKGTVAQSGQDITMDLGMTRSGGSTGTLAVNQASFQILTTGGSTYIKVTAGFLKYAHLPSAACNLMCDKYLKLPASQASSLVGDLNMGSFTNSVAKGKPDFRYKGHATVNGQDTWKLLASDGSTAYVASSGPAYLLRLVGTSGRGTLNFTQWNSVKVPAAPPASQVVDLSQLQHG